MGQQSKKCLVRKDMVRWYNPFQLARTGVQIATSKLLGARSDYRLMESFIASEKRFDYSDKREFWIDYVADLGDGWNPTYTVASLLARANLTVQDLQGKPYPTQRGNVLIMGGDEVYPTASRKEYQQRLVGPYECAFEKSEEPYPHVFAIPGNHDWYDGLVSFMRQFCRQIPRRWIGGWQTRQRRSYFALKLPHHWWLLGVDIQLESDIDGPQLEYFSKIAEEMKEGDRVILCTPKPDWIYDHLEPPELESNLAYLERKVIQPTGARVLLKLAGDIHHYRRHESTDGSGVHMITSGGGGAFLHPTIGPKVDFINHGPPGNKIPFKRIKEFPSKRCSRLLAFQNLLFPVLNPGFGLVTGAAYTILNWVLKNQAYQSRTLGEALKDSTRDLIQSPSGIFWVLVILVGFVLFTETHKKLYRWVAGLIHGLSHLLATLIVGWGAVQITASLLEPETSIFTKFLCTMLGTFIGGFVLGSFLVGLYLLISLIVFRRHANEAFSSLRIQDYKNFVRIHLDTKGELTVHPNGIRKVPRDWVVDNNAGPGDPKRVPKNSGIKTHLIEGPIPIKP